MTTTATMRAIDETRGAIRVEEVYDTDIEDLWQACTTPERLARWIAQVSGDARPGGTVHAVFHQHLERRGQDRQLRGTQPPPRHHPTRHRRRGGDRGVAHPAG